MKTLAIAGITVSSLLVVAVIVAALGGIWTDASGRVDDTSRHLWLTAVILLGPACFSMLLSAFLWAEWRDAS